MKITTVKNLKSKFEGKICTVLTSPIVKSNFTDIQFADFFTCLIDSIDEDGIFASHPQTGCQNFYTMQNVIGIIEEQLIDKNDPQYQQVISELQQKDDKFANLQFMNNLTKQ